MAIEDFDQVTIEAAKLRPFSKFIMSIGELPTSYLDSLSYAEQVTWFCDYLQNHVIPAVNNNATALEEVQNLMTELQTYVSSYFDNLDVQEEVNIKLDAMAEDGTLEALISQYVDNNVKRIYTDLSTLKNTNLSNNIKVQTLGYHTINDGGGANYIIRDTQPTNYYESLNNGNYAELILGDVINIEMFGAVGDGTTNDTTSIKNAINVAKNNNVKLTTCGKTYLINEDLTLNSTYFDLNSGTLKAPLNNKITLTKDNKNDLTTNGGTLINGTLEKIKVYVEKGHNNLSYININEWVGNAIETNDSFEDFISNIRLLNNSNSIDLVGIYNNSSDETFSYIYGVGAYTGIVNKGADCIFDNIHLWLNVNNTFAGSSFMKLEGTCSNITNCCCDSYENCFNFINTYLKLNIDNFLWINNSTLFQNKNFNMFIGQTTGHSIKGKIICRLSFFNSVNNKLYLNNAYELRFTLIDGLPQDKIGRYNYTTLNTLISGTDGTFHESSIIELNDGKLTIDAMLYANGTTTTGFTLDLTSFVDYTHYATRGFSPVVTNNYQSTGIIEYILANGILTVSIPSQSTGTTSINSIPLKLEIPYRQ